MTTRCKKIDALDKGGGTRVKKERTMRKLLASLLSLFHKDRQANAIALLERAAATEKYLHWFLLGSWWFVLLVGVFLLIPSAGGTWTDLGTRTLCVSLIGIMSALLWREARRRPRKLPEERGVVQRLLTVSRALLTLDLGLLLQRLIDEVVQLVPSCWAGLILLKPQQEGAERIVTAGRFPVPLASKLYTALTQGKIREALAHGVVALNTPEAIHAQLHSFQGQGLARQNLVIVPIRRHQLLGFLILADRNGKEGFRDEDIQTLTSVAEQAALAIENARVFAGAREAEAERRAMLHALINAQEQERKRVTEAWHTQLGTKLFEILQGLRSCQALIGQRVPECKERLDKLASEIDAAAALVRGFTNELHPAVLDDFGFVAALREYVASLDAQAPFRVTVQADDVDQQLPSEANLTLFRITQEALLNIQKHAHAQNVQIALVQEHAGVSLMIKDDGQGFNSEQSLPGHYGLLYMRERAEACGGTFRVVSARGQGTEVRVDFPGGGRTTVKLSQREHPE